MPSIAWGSQLYSYCQLHVTADLDSNKLSTTIAFVQHRLVNVQQIAIVCTNTRIDWFSETQTTTFTCWSLHIKLQWSSYVIESIQVLPYTKLYLSCYCTHLTPCKTAFMYTFLSSLFIHQFIKCTFASVFYSCYDKNTCETASAIHMTAPRIWMGLVTWKMTMTCNVTVT